VARSTPSGIALELWHRRHEAWPETLQLLVPELLPAVPPDRVDGKPLRYVVRDGRPVLYSIGADRRDDNGTPGKDPEGDMTMVINYGVVKSTSPVRQAALGDWIHYPPPKETFEEN